MVVVYWRSLITVRPEPPGSSDSFRHDGGSFVAYDPGYGLDIDSVVICQQPAVTTWWVQDLFGDGGQSGHASVSILPLACPESFTTVAMSIRN